MSAPSADDAEARGGGGSGRPVLRSPRSKGRRPSPRDAEARGVGPSREVRNESSLPAAWPTAIVARSRDPLLRGDEDGCRRPGAGEVWNQGGGETAFMAAAMEDAPSQPDPGARGEGTGRGLRAPEQRDHREHDGRAARRRRGWRRAHDESRGPAAARPARRGLVGRLPRRAPGSAAPRRRDRRSADDDPADRPARAADAAGVRRHAPSRRHRLADPRRNRARARGHLPLHRSQRHRRSRRAAPSQGQPRPARRATTAGIAHEFRNGLATIHGYARLLDSSGSRQTSGPSCRIRDETDAPARWSPTS